MMEGNPLSKLVIDYWYKAMIIVGFSLFVLACVHPIAVIGNAALMAASVGMMCIGIGEWINHPYRARIGRFGYNDYVISSHPRKVCRPGMLLDIAGVAFVMLGIVAAIKNLM